MSKKYPLLFKDSKKEEKEKRRQEAITKAKEAAKILRAKYKAEKVVLFGSVLDPNRFYLHSDVDLAVFGLKDELFYKAYAEVMNVLSGFEVDLIDEYRAFRHVVRNVYANKYSAKKISILLDDFPNEYSRVRKEIQDFLAFLQADIN